MKEKWEKMRTELWPRVLSAFFSHLSFISESDFFVKAFFETNGTVRALPALSLIVSSRFFPALRPSAHFVARCRGKPRPRPLWEPGFFSSGFWRLSHPWFFPHFTSRSFFFSNMCLKTQKMWSLPLSVLTFCLQPFTAVTVSTYVGSPIAAIGFAPARQSFDHAVKMKSSAGWQDTMYELGHKIISIRDF